MIRLLLVSYYYPPSIGGVERQSHLLARKLVERGHQVQVVCATQPGAPRRELLDGVCIERVTAGRGSRWTKMAMYLSAMGAAALRLGRDADVIQVQQALYPAAAMVPIARLLGKPLVVRNAGSGRFGAMQLMGRLPLGPTALGVAARGSTGVALNDEMRDEMGKAGFRRIALIPNGVELPPATTPAARASAQARLAVTSPVILCVGRLEAEKGIGLLVDAWRRVRRPATLLIVGDGPDREQLARAASGTSARFRGATADVSGYLEAADLFVLPSASEGISNALLEAMAAGLPVVATDVAGNRQVIRSRDHGVLVPHDAAAMASALDALIADPASAARIGAAARQHVANGWHVDRMVDAYERLYQSVRPAR
jgi:glycosyltransferase involved in cell wall biosynthesis